MVVLHVNQLDYLYSNSPAAGFRVSHSQFLRATVNARPIARICYHAIARPSVRRCVCPSVRWVDHRKTVEFRIMKFTPYGSPITLVFAG